MIIKYELTDENVKLPKKGSEKAAAYDVYAQEIIKEAPDFVRVKTGLKLQPDEDYGLFFIPRSSITNTRWVLQNSPALGDEDFTGEYELRYRAFPMGITVNTDYQYDEKYVTYELEYEPFPYNKGDRVAQLFAGKVIPIIWEEKPLAKTNRGEGGFGSTGK